MMKCLKLAMIETKECLDKFDEILVNARF